MFDKAERERAGIETTGLPRCHKAAPLGAVAGWLAGLAWDFVLRSAMVGTEIECEGNSFW